MYESRHYPDLRLSRSDHPRAIRSDQPRVIVPHQLLNPYHIRNRDSLGDGHDKPDPGFSSLDDGVRCKSRRDKDHRSVCPGSFYRLPDGIENGKVQMSLPAFPGSNASYHLRSVFNHLTRMKGPFTAGESLDDHS